MSALYKINPTSVQLIDGSHPLPLDAMHCRKKVQDTAASALNMLIAENQDLQRALVTAKQQGHRHVTIRLVNDQVTIASDPFFSEHTTPQAQAVAQRVHALYNDCIGHRCQPVTETTDRILRIEKTLQTLLAAVQQNDPARITSIQSTLNLLRANVEALHGSTREHLTTSAGILAEAVETTQELLAARERITALQDENHAFQTVIGTLQEQIESLGSSLTQALLTEQTQRAELIATQAQLREASQNSTTQDAAIQRLQHQVSALTSSLKEKETIANNLQSQLEEAISYLQASTEQLSTLQSHTETLDHALNLKQEELSQAFHDRDALGKQLTAQDQAVEALQSQLEEAIAHLQAVTAQLFELQTYTETLQDTLHTKQEQLSQASQERNALVDQLEDQKSEVATLRSHLEQSISQEEFVQELSLATDRRNRLSIQLDETNDTITTLSNEIASLRSDLDHVRATAQSRQEALTSLQESLQQAEQKNRTFETGRQQLVEATEQYRQLVEELANANQVLRSDREELFNLMDANQKELARALVEQEEMGQRQELYMNQEGALTTAQFLEINRALTQLASQQSRIESLRDQMHQLLQKSGNQQSALENKIASLNHSVEQARGANTTLQQERSQLLEEKRQLEMQLQEYESALVGLDDKNRSLLTSSNSEREALRFQLDEMTERASIMSDENSLPLFNTAITDLLSTQSALDTKAYVEQELEGCLQVLRNRIVELEERIHSNQRTHGTQVSSLRSQLENALSNVAQLEEQLADVTTAKKGLLELRNHMQERIAALEEEVRCAGVCVEEMRIALQTADKKHVNEYRLLEIKLGVAERFLQQERKALKEEKNKLEALQNDNTQLTEQLEESLSTITQLHVTIERLSEELNSSLLNERKYPTSHQHTQYPEEPALDLEQEEISSNTTLPASSEMSSPEPRSTQSLEEEIDACIQALSASPIRSSKKPSSSQLREAQRQLSQLQQLLTTCFPQENKPLPLALLPSTSNNPKERSFSDTKIQEIISEASIAKQQTLSPLKAAHALLAETGDFSKKTSLIRNLEKKVSEQLNKLTKTKHLDTIGNFIRESSIIQFTTETLCNYYKFSTLLGIQDELIKKSRSLLESTTETREEMQSMVDSFQNGHKESKRQQAALQRKGLKEKLSEEESVQLERLSLLIQQKPPAQIMEFDNKLARMHQIDAQEEERVKLNEIITRYETKTRKIQGFVTFLLDRVSTELKLQTPPQAGSVMPTSLQRAQQPFLRKTRLAHQ